MAYESESPRLVPGDTNKKADVFVYDLAKRTTVRASLSDVFVFDRASAAISRVSTYPGQVLSLQTVNVPQFRATATGFAFDSTAQLVPGPHEPHRDVVYVRRLR